MEKNVFGGCRDLSDGLSKQRQLIFELPFMQIEAVYFYFAETALAQIL